MAALAAATTLAGIGLASASAAPPPVSAGSKPVVDKPVGTEGKQPAAELVQAARAQAGRTPQPAATLRPARTENVYVAITPCRIVDTRFGGGKINRLAVRRFYVRGTFGFAPQGGKSGGCGVPNYATSVTTNVTVTGTTGSGYLASFPYPTTTPMTNFVTYWGDRAVTVPANFTLSKDEANPYLGVKNFGYSTDVIMDVTGYYMPPIEGLVTGGEAYQGSTRVLSSVKVATGVYNVTVEGDVGNCAPFVTPYYGTSVYASAYTYGSNIVRVYLWTLNTTGAPVAYNGYFYLYVAC